VIRSVCAQSGRPLRIDIDTELNYRLDDGDGGLRLFVPLVDVSTLNEPSIIDSF
jgi:hypothetical protein